MAEYNSNNKQNNYSSAESSSYAFSSRSSYRDVQSNSDSGSSLYVVEGQVKEKKMGICTCNKVGNCRGTCRT